MFAKKNKMKKLLLLFVLVSSFIFWSCDEDEDTVAEQLEKDIELIENYLADSNLTAIPTDSGLFYYIEEEGIGDRPDVFSFVTVTYTGKLLNGEVFDEGEVKDDPLYTYIKGWWEGIPLFKEGGKGTLYIPSKLGYGAYPKGDIPANSVLIFDIELTYVELREP